MLDLTQLPGAFLLPFKAIFGCGSPYGPPSLICAFLFTLGFYLARRRGRPLGVADFFAATFPKRIVWSESSRLDIRLWALNGIVLSIVYGVMSIDGKNIHDLTVAVLTRAFGARDPLAWPAWIEMSLATLAGLLAYEFAYWFGHFLFHRCAFLWEFHKVHHSAQTMTVFTELRQHPVEILAFINLIAIFGGVSLGALHYVFGPDARTFTLLGGNIVLMGFLLTWGHLRHSHIWISFRGVAGRLLQSPAHHQIHHSDNPAHWDKNLGFCLAIFDWLFGTLYIPAARREDIVFGVGPESAAYRSVADAFLPQFGRSLRRLAADPAAREKRA